jgi:integrase
MSALVEKYLVDAAQERDWPKKTSLRKKAELAEFIELCGDKPANQYTQADGVAFRDAQGLLPANRLRPPFKGLSLRNVIAKAKAVTSEGGQCPLLSPTTIADKLNTASGFFEWAKTRDASVVNPVSTLKLKRGKKRAGKARYPFTTEELNRLFAAQVYTGCRSKARWHTSGSEILDDSALYWVPLIGLFSGLRLGEIIQLRTEDIRVRGGIPYFDITTHNTTEGQDGGGSDNAKSLKTSSSQREVPVHTTLIEIGFCKFVERRRTSRGLRLFEEFKRSADDESWSKQFSKHFKRFRDSADVRRPGVTFHSFRHNVEDALRNADVRKEIRDAIQGHGENGVSKEYGSGYYLVTLSAAVQKIAFEGLDLSHLIRPGTMATSAIDTEVVRP